MRTEMKLLSILMIGILIAGCTQQPSGNQTSTSNNTQAPPANQTPVQSANTTTIVVKIYDPQNNPLPGAIVYFYNAPGSKEYYTDDRGVASIEITSPEESTGEWAVTKKDYERFVINLAKENKTRGVIEVHLKLKNNLTVEVDEEEYRYVSVEWKNNRKPVAGATVKVYDQRLELLEVTYTDEDGTASLNFTSDSVAIVEVSKEGYEKKEGYPSTDSSNVFVTLPISMKLIAKGMVDEAHRLCANVIITNKNYKIEAIFEDSNDTSAYIDIKPFGNFTRTAMYGIDCPRASATLNESECSTSGCDSGGIYCNLLEGALYRSHGGGAGSYNSYYRGADGKLYDTSSGFTLMETWPSIPLSIDKPAGNYTICVWTSSPNGYLWRGYLYAGYSP